MTKGSVVEIIHHLDVFTRHKTQKPEKSGHLSGCPSVYLIRLPGRRCEPTSVASMNFSVSEKTRPRWFRKDIFYACIMDFANVFLVAVLSLQGSLGMNSSPCASMFWHCEGNKAELIPDDVRFFLFLKCLSCLFLTTIFFSAPKGSSLFWRPHRDFGPVRGSEN